MTNGYGCGGSGYKVIFWKGGVSVVTVKFLWGPWGYVNRFLEQSGL